MAEKKKGFDLAAALGDVSKLDISVNLCTPAQGERPYIFREGAVYK